MQKQEARQADGEVGVDSLLSWKPLDPRILGTRPEGRCLPTEPPRRPPTLVILIARDHHPDVLSVRYFHS